MVLSRCRISRPSCNWKFRSGKVNWKKSFQKFRLDFNNDFRSLLKKCVGKPNINDTKMVQESDESSMVTDTAKGMELNSLMEDEKIVQSFLEMDEGHQTCQFKQLEGTIEHTDEQGGIDKDSMWHEVVDGLIFAIYGINNTEYEGNELEMCGNWGVFPYSGVTDGVLPSEEFIEEDLVSLFFTTRWEYDHRAVLLLVVSGDEDAIRCKVVALIKADKIEDAFSKIQYAQKDSFDFSFYKAYCLYRQNKLDEVLELLSWHIILLVL
ncbi:hypothetical protein V6N11_082971 [Hibiscus sabdariffa]|uniref:Uncharacterized protein n=1 Tax=Hibiscus sabdariffa TaxID=183260 RepID=A0ABR2QKF5_9ROSI